MLENFEYGLVVVLARCLGFMPRSAARFFARLLAIATFWCFGRLRRAGLRNLEMALPNLTSKTRRKILRGVYIHLAWQLVEFCRMSRYTAENTRCWMRTERFGVTYQSGALWSSMTLAENIALPLAEFTDLSDWEIRAIARLKL